MCLLLALDTSSFYTFVLVKKGSEIFSKSTSAENSHNEEIDKLVKEVFELAGADPVNLDQIIVGSGPGSFTGLRIGYSYVKGLAFALSVPVFSYSSLEAVAYYIHNKVHDKQFKEGYYCIISDARRDEYFVCFCKIDTSVEIFIKPTILNTAELENLIKQYNSHQVYRVNVSALPNSMISPDTQEIRPDFSESLLLYHEHEPVKALMGAADLSLLEPFYIRQVAAKSLKDRGITTREGF